jgi:protein O-mannosyl-transferase
MEKEENKKLLTGALILIIISGFFVYFNSLNGKFLWDDNIIIRDNTHIKNWSYSAKIFTEDFGAGGGKEYHFYRPLQIFTHAIDYSLWGLDPQGYHFVNTLLHILVALSLFRLVYLLFGDLILSFLTAFIFVIHPIHTEAVSYISGRSDSLCALFMLLCFIFYIKLTDKTHPKQPRIYFLMLLSYILAFLSKESALVLPALLLLYNFAFRKKINPRAFISILGIAAIYMFLRFNALRGSLPGSLPLGMVLQRIPGFFVAVTNYIRLLILPFDLHADYGRKLFSFSDPRAIAGLLIFLSLVIFAIARRKKDKLTFFSVSWFFIALLPTSNVHSAAFDITFYMAEHWLYFPSIGFFLILANVLTSMYNRRELKKAAIIIGCSVVLFYSYLTISQNNYWNDPVHFYKKTLEYVPESSRMNYNLGNELRSLGRLDEAVDFYKKAIICEPRNAEIYVNLAGVYNDLGKLQDALASLNKAIEIKPDFVVAHYNLGNVHKDSGNLAQAIVSYENALSFSPHDPNICTNLGIAYSQLGKNKESISYFLKAIEAAPGFAEGYVNLAMAYFQQKDYGSSVVYYEKAIKLGAHNAILTQALAPYR